MHCDWLKCRDWRGHYCYPRKHCKTADMALQDTGLALRPSTAFPPWCAQQGSGEEGVTATKCSDRPQQSSVTAASRHLSTTRKSEGRGGGWGEVRPTQRSARGGRGNGGPERCPTGDRPLPERKNPVSPKEKGHAPAVACHGQLCEGHSETSAGSRGFRLGGGGEGPRET